MQMLYNSDHFAVMAFEVPAEADTDRAPRGGFEIVDKLSRKGIYLEGALAHTFQQGAQALVAQGPTAEAMDEYLAGYTALAQQPVILH
jgi:hypothetical protein